METEVHGFSGLRIDVPQETWGSESTPTLPSPPSLPSAPSPPLSPPPYPPSPPNQPAPPPCPSLASLLAVANLEVATSDVQIQVETCANTNYNDSESPFSTSYDQPLNNEDSYEQEIHEESARVSPLSIQDTNQPQITSPDSSPPPLASQNSQDISQPQVTSPDSSLLPLISQDCQDTSQPAVVTEDTQDISQPQAVMEDTEDATLPTVVIEDTQGTPDSISDGDQNTVQDWALDLGEEVVTKKDFLWGKQLGRGSYARVVIAIRANDATKSTKYAIKIVDKSLLFKYNRQSTLIIEKKVISIHYE